MAQDLFRPRLVETEREREGVAAGVRDAVELADRRNVGFAVRAAESLGDVEHDVRASGPQPLGKLVVRLEANYRSKTRERALDGGDRLGRVPLGVFIVHRRRRGNHGGARRGRGGGPGPRVPATTRRLVLGKHRLARDRDLRVRRLGLLVVGESDSRHPLRRAGRLGRTGRSTATVSLVPAAHSHRASRLAFCKRGTTSIAAQNKNVEFFAQ